MQAMGRAVLHQVLGERFHSCLPRYEPPPTLCHTQQSASTVIMTHNAHTHRAHTHTMLCDTEDTHGTAQCGMAQVSEGDGVAGIVL